MFYLTEKERLEALDACDRIIAEGAKLQAACAAAIAALDQWQRDLKPTKAEER